jgi:hypothetical protein
MSESTMTMNGEFKVWRNSNGDLHRTDGPAVERWDHKAWYVRGKLHRTDGPAVERWDHKEWCVGGEFLGYDNEGFWALWEQLSDEDRVNPTLLSYLPGDFSV